LFLHQWFDRAEAHGSVEVNPNIGESGRPEALGQGLRIDERHGVEQVDQADANSRVVTPNPGPISRPSSLSGEAQERRRKAFIGMGPGYEGRPASAMR
jgi:hypothetical protein